MNKKELVLKVASKTELDTKGATILVDTVFESILEGLIEDRKVDIGVLGKLEVVDKAARIARNPSTGDPVEVPAKKAPKYKPGKAIKEALNA